MAIVRRRDLLGAGYQPDEVRRWLHAGELVSVRRGTYTHDVLPSDEDELHGLRIRAALPELAASVVVSHVSAAVLHGLPTWGLTLDRIHVTRARRSGARCGRAVHLHAAPLEPAEVVDVGGIAVTSPARTVADIARTSPFESAVVLTDRALHLRLVDTGRLDIAVVASARRPGAPRARRVLAFAEGRSESVGESRSRIAIARAGLPAPVLQWDVASPSGEWLGRADFGWPTRLTVGEFDGRVKYGRLLRADQEPGDVVFAEKRREDAMRDAGLRVVRWTWADLSSFDTVAERLRRALR